MNKPNVNLSITNTCEELLNDIQCDFVGFAFQNQVGPDIRWCAASGNSNDKYKRITVRYGKGIAGRVISTGRPMMIQSFPDDIIGTALEYPIMLAEKLLYSYAVPVHFRGIPKGVLLVGLRTKGEISEEDKNHVQKAAYTIEEIFQKSGGWFIGHI